MTAWFGFHRLANYWGRDLRLLITFLLLILFVTRLPAAQPTSVREATQEAMPIPAKVDINMMSKKQAKDLWVMVGRFAQIEIILESCQRRSNIERRIIKVASPCVEVRTLKNVRRHFRNKLAYYRKRVVALDCQAKDVRALLRAGKKAVDQVISHVSKQCQACFFC